MVCGYGCNGVWFPLPRDRGFIGLLVRRSWPSPPTHPMEWDVSILARSAPQFCVCGDGVR